MLLVGIIFELTQAFLSRQRVPVHNLLNIFTLFETLFILYFFKEIFLSALARRISVIIGVIFIVLWLFIYFLKSGFDTHLDVAYAMECIIIIALSIYYFYEQLRKPDSLYIYSQTRFWIVAAYLVYTAGTFFLFLYQKDLSMEEQKKYFVLNSVFVIFKSIILSIAMCMKAKNTEKRKFQLT